MVLAKFFEYIELEKIYRQKDKDFINTLNAIRENNIDYKPLNILNENISVTENIKFIRKNNDEVTVETNSFYFEGE